MSTYFEDHEKTIYSPPSEPDRKYDPLAVARQLDIASEGRLDELLHLWQPIDGSRQTGDIHQKIDDARLQYAQAEEHLVRIARKVFGFEEFPVSTDAQALEVLVDYLHWMKKKGQRDASTPT